MAARSRALPERLALPDRPNTRKLKERWWQFGHHAHDLVEKAHGLDRVIACSQTSKYRSFTFLPSGMVYDQKLVVCALCTYSAFCVLQCRVHDEWALFLGSTMKDDPVYRLAQEAQS